MTQLPFQKDSSHSVFQRLLKGAFWSVAATAASSLFNLSAGIICARVLGAETFGRMGVLQSTVGFAGLLAGLGLGTTATRFVALHHRSNPALCGRMLGGVLMLAILTVSSGALAVLLGADLIATSCLDTPELAGAVRICAVWVFSLAAGEILLASLAGLEAFRAIATLSLLRGGMVFVGTIGGLGWGLEGSLIGWSFGLVVGAGLLLRALFRECSGRGIHLSIWITLTEVKTLLAYAVPTLASGLSYVPFAWLTNTIIARSPGGFEQMALLNVAYQWRGLFTYLPVSLGRAVLPLLGSSETEGTASSSRAFAISNLVNQWVVWGCGLLFLGASGLLLALYGEDFRAGRWAYILILGGAMLGYVGNSFGTLIQIRGLFRLGIFGNLLSGLSLVGCTFLWGGRLGAVAVGIGTILGYFLNLAVCGAVLIREDHVPPHVGKRVLMAAAMALGLIPILGLGTPVFTACAAAVLLPASGFLIFHYFAKPEGLTGAILLGMAKRAVHGRVS